MLMQLWEATECVLTYMGTAVVCHTCRALHTPSPGARWWEPLYGQLLPPREPGWCWWCHWEMEYWKQILAQNDATCSCLDNENCAFYPPLWFFPFCSMVVPSLSPWLLSSASSLFGILSVWKSKLQYPGFGVFYTLIYWPAQRTWIE